MRLRVTRLTAIASAVQQLITSYNPGVLFTNNEQGVWYDPSDMTTLFQDAAGTTPVTAVEQPVGRMLDKSGRGNHATQATAINRPALSARVNLLTKTEQFDDAVWSPSTRIVVTPNDTISPNGLQTADKIAETADNGTHRVTQSVIFASNTQYKLSCYWKKGTRRWVWLSINNSADNCNQFFDLDSLSLGASQQAGASVVKVSASITDAGNGWVFCQFTANIGAATVSNTVFTGMAPSDGVPSYAGSASEHGYIWGADLRPSNDGVGIPPYQRINTATDYDSVGFPVYLRADGVDDGMVTNSIDFTATDKMTVVAGVRKLSDAATAILAELSATTDTNVGAFYLGAPSSGGVTKFSFNSRGSVLPASPVGTASSTYSAPVSSVVAAISSISEDTRTVRLNSTEVATGGGVDQGTGNFGNYPLYLFRRGGSSLPFNGRFYGMTIVNKLLSTTELTQLETYTNSKTRAYVPPTPSYMLLENSDKLLLEDSSLIILEA